MSAGANDRDAVEAPGRDRGILNNERHSGDRKLRLRAAGLAGRKVEATERISVVRCDAAAIRSRRLYRKLKQRDWKEVQSRVRGALEPGAEHEAVPSP